MGDSAARGKDRGAINDRPAGMGVEIVELERNGDDRAVSDQDPLHLQRIPFEVTHLLSAPSPDAL
jgi:hypothetical protein